MRMEDGRNTERERERDSQREKPFERKRARGGGRE